MSRTMLALLLAAGCSGGSSKATPEAPTPAPAPAPAPTPAPAPPTPTAQTPQELYASCMERVEGKQADGECKADADCAPAGCGKEVCVAAAEAANVMTTCEEQPCFKVLDTCGCHEGKCTWTLKAEAPPPGPATSLPSSLPPTAPAPAPAPAEPAPK